jgi:hypothetical protein
MMEPIEYRDVPGFDGYRVGSDGTVWTRKTRSGGKWFIGEVWQQMKTTPINGGYMQVGLSRPGHSKDRWCVHQLVMLAFRGPAPDGMVVCHEDNTPGHDWLSNLRYDTQAGNLADRKKFGTEIIGERNGRAILDTVDVAAIRAHPISRGSAQKLAARFGVSPETIRAITTRRLWKHVA